MNWTNTLYVKIGFENRTNKSMFNEHNKKSLYINKYNDIDKQQQQNKDRDLIK